MPFILSLIFSGHGYSAVQLHSGVALMEEGDDRWRRGVNLSLRVRDYRVKGFLFRREFGPVKEQSILISAVRFYKLPYLGAHALSVGAVALEEATLVRYDSFTERSYDKDERRRNFGLSTGLHWGFDSGKHIKYRFDWESALFPAGLFPGLLLATGRKQTLSFTLGYQF